VSPPPPDYSEQLAEMRVALTGAYAIAQRVPYAEPMLVDLAEAIATCEFLEAVHRSELRQAVQ
jgi:hypothetical protein